MQKLTAEDYKKYIGLHKDFAFEKLEAHEETAFRKNIFPYISEDIIIELKGSEDEVKKQIADLILKAGACYSVVKALPFIKVKITSFGMEKYQQEKMKNADWWDVRDIGLSLVKTADEALSDALTEIAKDSALKSRCNFFTKHSFAPIPTPEEFNSVYTINKSMDVYLNLVPLMKRVWLALADQLKDCVVAELSTDEDLIFLLKDAIVYSSLGKALKLSQFTFITSGVVIQYEEMPWQKSLILSDVQKNNLAEEFRETASEAIGGIIKYLKNNPEKFPCYKHVTVENVPKIIEKKSGLYL
ncbi:DUF6712 family protein [Chryseobacterium sp. YIM B08800]|uniref:DUF6712 family protein n=1 Tax=Chryseobacterium sp. YIM B08800 TaxID=2984136 RepID=UPI00223F1CF8|nr:DUF6712 family protein [Chryseobacterium sp. YIM B08800]